MAKLLREIANRWFDITIDEISKETVSDYLDKAEKQLNSYSNNFATDSEEKSVGRRFKKMHLASRKLHPESMPDHMKPKIPATNEADMSISGGSGGGVQSGVRQKRLRQGGVGKMTNNAGGNAGIQKGNDGDSGMADPTKKKQTAGILSSKKGVL